jgi:DNA polymerase III subunit delta'
MFDHLLLHEAARITLPALVAHPPQSVLFVGPDGIGKRTVAIALAAELAAHPTAIQTVAPDERGTISIEVIRALYKATRAKQETRQVIIIERADCMSIEAENAFLKLLEEPRAGLTFILTALQQEALLPTILSRVQYITLPPLPDETLRRLIMAKKPGIAGSDLAQLIFLAQGRPGIALALLQDGSLDTQRQRMQLVKQLIAAKPYERFALVSKLAASRDECLETLQAMMRVTEAQLSSATSAAMPRWLKLADALQNALQAISHNGNIRAQLLYLFSNY